MDRCRRQTTDGNDVQANYFILGTQQDYAELLSVGLALRLYQTLNEGLGLLGVIHTAVAKRDAFVFDQGHTIDGNELAGGLVLRDAEQVLLFHGWPPFGRKKSPHPEMPDNESRMLWILFCEMGFYLRSQFPFQDTDGSFLNQVFIASGCMTQKRSQ
jgi:hypothetical protein